MSSRAPRSRGWCFTLNNYGDEDVKVLSEGGATPQDVVYLLFGKEVSSSGTLHLQGYVHFKTVKSFKQVKAAISDRAHVEPRQGTVKQACEYCCKDGDVVEYGNRPNQGKRTDLEEVTQKILSGTSLSVIAEESPTVFVKYSRGLRDLALISQKPYIRADVCGLWIFGEPGTGKSDYASTLYPSAYRKAQNKWWDGYAGEKVVILDDLDSPALCHHLKIWADKWACTGETKGGTVHLKHDVFIVTSNYKISEIVSKNQDQPDFAMIAALERRFKTLEIRKKFYPPAESVGAGSWKRLLVDEDGAVSIIPERD